MYTVKEASEIMGVTAHTLRFYDREGLFPNLTRDARNRQLFSESDFSCIRMIKSLREMGFSLSDVRSFLQATEKGDGIAEERHSLIVRQIERVKADLAAMKRQMEMLNAVAAHYGAVRKTEKALAA